MQIVFKFFLLLLFTPASSYADLQPDVIDFESEITVASWLFPESPLYNGQEHNNSVSFTFFVNSLLIFTDKMRINNNHITNIING